MCTEQHSSGFQPFDQKNAFDSDQLRIVRDSFGALAHKEDVLGQFRAVLGNNQSDHSISFSSGCGCQSSCRRCQCECLSSEPKQESLSFDNSSKPTSSRRASTGFNQWEDQWKLHKQHK